MLWQAWPYQALSAISKTKIAEGHGLSLQLPSQLVQCCNICQWKVSENQGIREDQQHQHSSKMSRLKSHRGLSSLCRCQCAKHAAQTSFVAWAFLPEIRHLMAKHLLLLLEIPMADELVSTSISTMKPQKGMKRVPSWQCPFTGTVGSKFLPASDTICEVLSNCVWYRATHQVFSRDAVNSRPTVRRVFAFSSAERLEKAMEREGECYHITAEDFDSLLVSIQVIQCEVQCVSILNQIHAEYCTLLLKHQHEP